MAPITWKMVLTTATLAQGQHCSATDSCEDQTALLQSHLASHKSGLGSAETAHLLNFPKMATLSDPGKRKMALAQFEQTAMDLATSGTAVTDEVAEICQVTTELLESTVLNAIRNEHTTDVAMLAAAHHAFDPVENQRRHYEQVIEDAYLPVYGDGGLVDRHRECRQEESQICVWCHEHCHNCTIHDDTCEILGAELEQLHNDVINLVTQPAYCAGDPPHIYPPTSHQYAEQVDLSDHQANARKMQEYIDKLAEYEACEEDAPEDCTWCEVQPKNCGNHQAQVDKCDLIETDLQHEACDARWQVARLLTLYHAAFTAVETRYNQVKTQIMLQEEDRKVEWDTLERVICLLGTLVQTQDGATASTANREAIQACENDDIPPGGIGTDHLNIEYQAVPEIGTLPTLPESPCTDNFRNGYYNNITFCEGNPAAQEEFTWGFVDVCECNATEPPAPRYGFPYELGPYLLFDTGLALNSAEGFTANKAAGTWQATFEGSLYTGTLSPFKDSTLPGLDEAFGLSGEGLDSVVEMAWVYPNQEISRSIINRFGNYSEDMAHRFFRTGGYVWLNSNSEVVALKEVSTLESDFTNAGGHELRLIYAPPAEITEQEANTACPGGLKPANFKYIRNGGGLEYCWHRSATTPVEGPHGAFVYKVSEYDYWLNVTNVRWLSYALMAGSLPNATEHYAATDQQNADPASMELRYLAHGLEEHPIPADRIGGATDKAVQEGTTWEQLVPPED